jgi:acyl transferase domain-containing protein
MFAGGGAQYPNMGRGLYDAERVYRDAMDECLELVRPELGFDLRALLFPKLGDEESVREKLAQPSACLPAILATEWALARLWSSWGIEPDAMTGHSMGEYTAACAAGVMSLRDALRMVSVRGRLVDSIRVPGRMVSVALPPDELRAILPPSLDLGIVNGPALCVVSGPEAEIERFSAELGRREVEHRPLRVPAAGHSRVLDPILPEFRACVSAIALAEPEKPYVST